MRGAGVLGRLRRGHEILEPGPWSFRGSPRVLLEDPEEGRAREAVRALRAAGYSIAVCAGPTEEGPGCRSCPVTAVEPCALVNGADVVVSSLGFEGARARSVLLGLRYASMPRVVRLPEQEDLNAGDLAGSTIIGSHAGSWELVEAVRTALAAQW